MEDEAAKAEATRKQAQIAAEKFKKAALDEDARLAAAVAAREQAQIETVRAKKAAIEEDKKGSGSS